MVACRGRNDPPTPFAGAHLDQAIVCPPDLERTRLLEVFKFEKDFRSQDTAKIAGSNQRGRTKDILYGRFQDIPFMPRQGPSGSKSTQLARRNFHLQGLASGGDVHFSQAESFGYAPRRGAGKSALDQGLPDRFLQLCSYSLSRHDAHLFRTIPEKAHLTW